MDYLQQGWAFKLRKFWRYLRLYGPGRTWAKVQGQYHMRRRFDTPPVLPDDPDSRAHVGLIGCGNYAYTTIGHYLVKHHGRVIRGAMDVDLHKAASLARKHRAVYYTTDAQRILDDPAIDLVYIASNHASHAEYAIAALNAGKAAHIEKPHVVSADQLRRLCHAMTRTKRSVTLGFNRPGSRLGRCLRAQLARQDGPLMMNWFVAGHEIPADHWYFDAAEGGRVLGNLCHWTDFVYHLVPARKRYPIRINPTRAAQSDCDIAVTYTFGDGSIAAITFSAKGHTFEGVREVLSVHCGNLLANLRDFQILTLEEGAHKKRVGTLFRDHGHCARICASYESSRESTGTSLHANVRYVWETGELFLKTRQALENQTTLTVHPYVAEAASVERGVPVETRNEAAPELISTHV